MKPSRDIINEGRTRPQELDRDRFDELTAAYHNGALTMIPAQSKQDYYDLISADRPATPVAAKGQYCLISMDGQIFVTDGSNCENITLDWQTAGDVDTEVVLRGPVNWKTAAPTDLPKSMLRGLRAVQAFRRHH